MKTVTYLNIAAIAIILLKTELMRMSKMVTLLRARYIYISKYIISASYTVDL